MSETLPFVKLSAQAIGHRKLVLRLTDATIRLSSYGGQSKTFDPEFTDTPYDSLKDALTDMVEWRRRRKALRA